MEQIQDGTGKGYSMKIDEYGNAHVDAITTDRESYSSQKGESFNINTGLITLTNAATNNGVLYLKNNEKSPLIITGLFYNIGTSTGGAGDIIISIYRNPTTGTLISGASAVEMNGNRNFGSSLTLDILAYKGATGTTITDGSKIIESILGTTVQRVAVSAGSITLPKGSSIAIQIKTPTSNTSMAVSFAIACYLEVEENQV